jgi:hypothetical protein
MQTTPQSYRAVVQTAEPDGDNQLGMNATFGLKARSMTEAQILARAVSRLPVRLVYRQDRGAA